MKKIYVTGHEGNIGSRLLKLGAEPLFCDVTNQKEVSKELHRIESEDAVILHLAAMTSVDWCESHYDETIAVNVYGTNVLCEQAENIIGEGRVALISSDQVFDGKQGCYREGDEPNPVNNYGHSKLGAEAVAQLYEDKIIRISRCFDSKSKDISEYLEKLRNNEEVHVPNHLVRSYCHMDFMANMLFEYGNRFGEMPEILHLGGHSLASFFDLMCFIADEYELNYGRELMFARGEKPGYVARPHLAGLDVRLAESLGFRAPRTLESVARLKNETA